MALVTAIDRTEVVHEFPLKVREIENIYIPLSDGVQLAARMWLPDTQGQKYPAILEYLPYRKRDGTAARDELSHPYLAGHGYVCVRVDIRGYGESQGLMMEEYDPQEQADGLEVIDWITQQDWCDGNVGMWGISWGGFNALQVAALRPKALKAIMSLCSTDDRYCDDIHYHNGALLSENIGWAAVMQSYSAYAPDPVLVGDAWHDMWMQRLQNMPLHCKTWLEHYKKDDYWKHASISENYSSIEAAVYLVGGWWDSYHTALMRMLENITAPKKALVGPWAHKYPHFAIPDPAIGFLQEALRWWDYWLKGVQNGIMDEPLATFYMQESMPPAASYAKRDGYWIQEKQWPSPNVALKDFHIQGATLTQDKANNNGATVCINAPENVGAASGEFCIIWLGPEFPTDQRKDDMYSSVFTSAPLQEDLHILGAATFRCQIASDKPVSKWSLRLNDVFPSGERSRITYTVQNLCMRDSMEEPEYLEPGKFYDITVKLDDVAYIVPAGHCLSLSISDTYWPIMWPSPERTSLTMRLDSAVLTVPCHNDATKVTQELFKKPQSATPIALEEVRAGKSTRVTTEDAYTGRVTTEIYDDFGTLCYSAHGLHVDQVAIEKYSILPDDPTSAEMFTSWEHTVSRGDWSYKVLSTQNVRSDKEAFYIEAEQIAFEGEKEVHRQAWSEKVLRQYQ